MPLPDWNADGLLPAGIHSVNLSDVYDRCVSDAGHQAWRGVLYGALRTYIGIVSRIIPHATVWVDGGFLQAKPTAPHDVDIVIHPHDWHHLDHLSAQEEIGLFGALTLQDVIVGEPILTYLERIQPVAGALDAFLCWPGEEDVWIRTWSSVKGADGLIVPGMVKGFAEVTW